MNLDIASSPGSPPWFPSDSPPWFPSDSPPDSPLNSLPAKRPREVKLPEGEAVQPMEPIFIGQVRMPMDEGGGSDREAEEPKLAAGYYWIKHINGDTDLTEAAKQKADKYNMTELITRGIRFCTICGDEEHWAYVCPEFPVAYKRPMLKKKRRNPEEYWQQEDEDHLHENCITEREIVQYLHQFSPKKNIHRALVDQDREIRNFENCNARQMCIKFWEERHVKRCMRCRICGMVDDHWTLSCPAKDKDTALTQRGKDYRSEAAALDTGHTEFADEMKE